MKPTPELQTTGAIFKQTILVTLYKLEPCSRVCRVGREKLCIMRAFIRNEPLAGMSFQSMQTEHVVKYLNN